MAIDDDDPEAGQVHRRRMAPARAWTALGGDTLHAAARRHQRSTPRSRPARRCHARHAGRPVGLRDSLRRRGAAPEPATGPPAPAGSSRAWGPTWTGFFEIDRDMVEAGKDVLAAVELLAADQARPLERAARLARTVDTSRGQQACAEDSEMKYQRVIQFDAEVSRQRPACLSPESFEQRQAALEALDLRPGEDVCSILVRARACWLRKPRRWSGRAVRCRGSTRASRCWRLPRAGASRWRARLRCGSSRATRARCRSPLRASTPPRRSRCTSMCPRCRRRWPRGTGCCGRAGDCWSSTPIGTRSCGARVMSGGCCASWRLDEHLIDPYLPRRLTGLLEKAGFTIARREVLPILNAGYDPQTFSAG